ncbi:MAG: hypothetical protein RLZ60_393 [Pseudomonadota bacterium]
MMPANDKGQGMLKNLWNKAKAWEKARNKSYEKPIVTAEDRERAHYYAKWIDHGFLRVRWTNFDQIAEGVYRSNHPSPERMAEMAEMGIKTVINLRGGANIPTSLLSAEAAEKYGMKVITIGMSARSAPNPRQIVEFMDVMETAEKPVLIHCKSGADRTGLAAVIYLTEMLGVSVEDASAHLSSKYLHFKWSKTGVLDLFFENYRKAHDATGIGLREWVTTVYDQDALNREFAAR